MTPAEYLNATKSVMGIQSDYELAKKLETTTDMVSKIRSGKRPMPLVIATKIAITLNIDPITVIAENEAIHEKDSQKAAFWRSFLSRAIMVVATVCTLAFSSSDFSLNEPSLHGGLTMINHCISIQTNIA